MLAALDEPGGPARIAAQLKSRAAASTAGAFPEALVNTVGYEYLTAGNTAQAIAVFDVNVQAYPASPNAHDSLADGYMAAGQKDLARSHSQQALTLLATATDLTDTVRQAIRESAEAKLKLLGVK
jgi:Tfp pilus assembly protein PilF